MKNSFSFIVPCYNSENTIELCLDSIINQSAFSNNMKIIIIDDGSCDQTGEIIKKKYNSESCTIFRNNKNRGIAYSRNLGIKNSNAEILAFIDSDMVLGPHWIKKAINIFNNKNIIAAMGQYYMPIDVTPNDLDKYLYSGWRGAKKKYNNGDIIDYKYFLCSNTLVRSMVFDFVDGFDNNLKYYGGEDIEFAIRLNEKFSNKLYYFSELVCYHYGQKKLDVFCKNMRIYGQYNLPLIIDKHPDFKNNFGYVWLSSFCGYLVFNPIIMLGVNLVLKIKTVLPLIRYKIAYHTIVGYRNNNFKK